MKYLLLIFFVFALTLLLPARETITKNAAASKNNGEIYSDNFIEKFGARTLVLPAKNAGTHDTGLVYYSQLTLNSDNLFYKKDQSHFNYSLQNFQNQNFLKDSLLIPVHLAKSAGFSERNYSPALQPGFQYQLTSTDIHLFFGHSTYGKQWLKGTKLLVGVGVGMMGTLMILPRSVTRWQNSFVEDAMFNINESFTSPPVWDEDHWEINYVGHPYAGSIYYNTLRCQGATVPQSFVFSAFISTAWEYLYEGVAERPSIQDLVVTPVAGAVLGELTHQATVKMKKNGTNIFEKTFITIMNPVHAVFKGYSH